MVKITLHFSKLKKVRNLRLHTQTKQTTLNHLVLNSLALALLKVEILNKKCTFCKCRVFIKKCQFSQKMAMVRSFRQFGQKVRKTILQKTIFTNGGSLENSLFPHKKTKNCFSSLLKMGFMFCINVQRAQQIKLKSQVEKKFTRHFRRSKFQKSRSLRENDHFSEGQKLTKMVKSLFVTQSGIKSET